MKKYTNYYVTSHRSNVSDREAKTNSKGIITIQRTQISDPSEDNCFNDTCTHIQGLLPVHLIVRRHGSNPRHSMCSYQFHCLHDHDTGVRAHAPVLARERRHSPVGHRAHSRGIRDGRRHHHINPEQCCRQHWSCSGDHYGRLHLQQKSGFRNLCRRS